MEYGARSFDPSLRRFMNIDRFAEIYMSNTPYHYTLNNPVYYVDVNGDCVNIHYGEGQSILFVEMLRMPQIMSLCNKL